MATGKKTGGRKRGTPNKLTRSVKLALEESFTKMGGIAALVRWGKENPTEFYKLWAKILPVEAREADAMIDSELKQLQSEKLKAEIERMKSGMPDDAEVPAVIQIQVVDARKQPEGDKQ